MTPGYAVCVATLALVLVAAEGRATDGSWECDRWRTAFATMKEEPLTIEAGARTFALRARVAATSQQQAAGFQCATSAEIRETLILFDFDSEIQTQFHMQNVRAALDIAFVKADGRIFAILRMEPSPTALYGPLGPFRWAIEARAGFFESRGIRQGTARLQVGAR
jgi:uncharacterized membrane protein (UPF0127 family)